MLKKFISYGQDHHLVFDFSQNDFKDFYKKIIKDFYENILHDFEQNITSEIKGDFFQNKIKIFLLIKFLIWEAIKNSYDACFDKYLEKKEDHYFVNIQWSYQNNQFRLRIIDNGFGKRAADSKHKFENNRFYFGGKGKGMYIFLSKLRYYQEKYRISYKINCNFCPFGNGSIIDLEINFSPK